MPHSPERTKIPQLNLAGQLLPLNPPLIMGILNCTPDSFHASSRVQGVDAALVTALKMAQDGADILDIGGCSSRPGSVPPEEQEELDRVMPVIEKLRQELPQMPLSIDTFRAEVALQAIQAGCALVNDISAGLMDPELPAVVGRFKVPYVLMHMKGTPRTMQQDPEYKNVTSEVMQFFGERMAELKKAGITEFILDPGFGFGKLLGHNFQLLRELSAIVALGYPVLCGISRKSMVRQAMEQDLKLGPSTLGPEKGAGTSLPQADDPEAWTKNEQIRSGTMVAQTLAAANGCHILRVHDIADASLIRKIIWNYRGNGVTNL